ncbi:3-oxoacyl-ACP synthase III family protein [bacterium]
MSNKKASFIRGIGAFLPEKILGSAELEKRLELEAGWIEKKTGVASRRIAADGESVSDLAAGAGRAALENAGISPGDLDMIILSSSMGDMFFPSTACIVQNKIGAACPAFDVSNACSGFLHGIAVASSFVQGGTCDNILVIAAETMSRMIDWNDYKTCILFGDGAGAVVVSGSGDHRIVDYHLGADGSGAEVLKLPGAGSRDGAKPDPATSGTVYMEGGEVFRFAMKIIGECVTEVAKKAGINVADIKKIIPHQSNIAIIREAAKILEIPVEIFHMNLNEVGNTAAASVPLALCDAVDKKQVSPGDTIVLASYGAGLAYASVLIEW